MKTEEKLTARDIDRIVEMAWEDQTPFDAIESQFGVSEKDVIEIMRKEMHPRNWRKWRARVQGRKSKHRAKKISNKYRFKSDAQRSISRNRISKKN